MNTNSFLMWVTECGFVLLWIRKHQYVFTGNQTCKCHELPSQHKNQPSTPFSLTVHEETLLSSGSVGDARESQLKAPQNSACCSDRHFGRLHGLAIVACAMVSTTVPTPL